jgi:hypothetical protein
LMIIVFPISTAGASFWIPRAKGKFQGTMPTETPRGVCLTTILRVAESSIISSGRERSAVSRRDLMPVVTSEVAKESCPIA